MSNEQAIKLLRKDTSADEMYSLTKYGLRSAEIQELLQEAMDIGADAIEKQMAKKPKGNYCPSCNEKVQINYDITYCLECGQKLDWSE